MEDLENGTWKDYSNLIERGSLQVNVSININYEEYWYRTTSYYNTSSEIQFIRDHINILFDVT